MSHHKLRDLFNRYGGQVYRRAMRILGNKADAEDALQEVFARAALHVDQLRPDTVIRWLYTTTTNYCLNLIRDRKRRRELLDEQEPRPKEITSTADALLTLRALLSKANEQEARAATYIYIDQLSQPEAADLMGISVRKLGYLLASFREWARTQVSENNK